MFILPWKDRPGFRVPITKGTRVEGGLSERIQDRSRHITPNEEAAVYDRIHKRYEALPDDDGEPIDE